ncbi:hypothetical protein G6F64_012154 [Rhizopus arrhizus]|uniref:TRP C-terminal domain-containing protein n=1 Tax=Rhizopus oryzae TaxID=64495 RepID=A0A9P7BL51_RHIOR|nr:hypothetical protein G6F64_012154 [Rhizopus arrhizus]
MITTLVCIILEALIVDADIKIYSDLQLIDPNITAYTSTSIHVSKTGSDSVALGLRRLKNENVFFILLSLFQLLLGLDAMLRQSVIQIMAHVTNQYLSIIFVAMQIVETREKDEDVNQRILNLIQSTSPAKSMIQTYFLVALRNGIGLVIVMSLLSLVFTYLCYQLYKQFGWNIYKRIGADIQQQHRFKLTQIFFLLLKLDAFFQLVLCIFYTVVMSQEAYYAMWSVDKKKFVGYVVHFVVTALLVPALLLARHSVITENKAIMGLFQASQIIMIVDFIVVLVDSAGSWIFWILAVCVAIFLCFVTVVVGVLVSQNFDKGLKPYNYLNLMKIKIY